MSDSAVIHCQIRPVYSKRGGNSLCTLYSCNQLKRRRQGWPTIYVSMLGKRLSLVCYWGPAAFHFLGWICCESDGEGRFALYYLYGKTGLIFKPDTLKTN